MGRHTGPKDRLSRREGVNLMLKGARSESGKLERRMFPPGMHHWRRARTSDYGIRLREKQKVKRYYGVLERQFRKYFKQAESARGNTGEVLMSLLERRLDNVVCRLGFGMSRSQSRLMVSHGHVTVNGRRVDVPSYLTRPGDVIQIKDRPKSVGLATANLEETGREVPDFLARLDGPQPAGQVVRMPETEDVSIPVQTQLIVELCSK